MEFQFGTNWATFSERSGSVVGQPLAMEGIFAFFLESIFLACCCTGEARVPTPLHALAALLVWIGSWLSGYLYRRDRCVDAASRRIRARRQRAHIELHGYLGRAVSAVCYLAVSPRHVRRDGRRAECMVAGVGAYYLLSGRDEQFARRFVRAGTIVAFVFSALVVFPTGDRNGADVTEASTD